MQDMGALFGPLTGGRISRRLSRRQHEDEARIAEMPPTPGDGTNLSEHIPSSLISLDDRVRALAVGGAPAWSRRLKRIHELTDAADEQLALSWRTAARKARGNARRFAAEWQRVVDGIDFSQINELIDHHNRYFPIEANLPMDVKTRDYVKFGGEDYRRRPLDAAWVLARFPADLEAALARPERSSGNLPKG
ncbi:MAG: hypothetical protein IT306_08585 [Chloroflexi bacterium]|nr:hypothetical protein [Chloroflexota bacterium]